MMTCGNSGWGDRHLDLRSLHPEPRARLSPTGVEQASEAPGVLSLSPKSGQLLNLAAVLPTTSTLVLSVSVAQTGSK